MAEILTVIFEYKLASCDFPALYGNCISGDCRSESCKQFPYTDQPERLRPVSFLLPYKAYSRVLSLLSQKFDILSLQSCNVFGRTSGHSLYQAAGRPVPSGLFRLRCGRIFVSEIVPFPCRGKQLFQFLAGIFGKLSPFFSGEKTGNITEFTCAVVVKRHVECDAGAEAGIFSGRKSSILSGSPQRLQLHYPVVFHF